MGQFNCFYRNFIRIRFKIWRIYLYRKAPAPASGWEPLAPVEVPDPRANGRGLGYDLALGERYLFVYSLAPDGSSSVATMRRFSPRS